MLKLVTSEESWKSIIESLSTIQKLIAADDDNTNRLALARPGSDKARVVIHRIAHLLWVRRVSATGIVALTFNRHVANGIRRRLLALVGVGAYSVGVLTYHSMITRLTGTRFERGTTVDERAFKQASSDAVESLEGKRNIEGEDDLCEQLLHGYRYILINEYQDIDDLQYRLVSALAGRYAEGDGRLCIMVIGDDDQNIYVWRGTNNCYIERFREDYEASANFLVGNYRSSLCIIEAANQPISQNLVRLKEADPVRIDRAWQEPPVGGLQEERDEQQRGQVMRLLIDPNDRKQGNLQAQVAMVELGWSLVLEQGSWSGYAVLTRTHRYLWPIQALCEQHDISYFLAAGKGTALPITRQRNFVAAIDYMREIKGALCTADARRRLSGSN